MHTRVCVPAGSVGVRAQVSPRAPGRWARAAWGPAPASGGLERAWKAAAVGVWDARGWVLSVMEVPCPAPGWWLHARDLIWPSRGHPVEWAAPPHLAGEDMQAELSHLLKVTQVGERGF